MRILACYYTHKPGGLCKRLYRLLVALAARGHSVHYYTLDEPPRALQQAGVVVHILPFPLKGRRGLLFWALFLILAPLLLLRAARAVKADRLLAFGAFYGALFGPARYLLGVPLIVFVRSLVFKINELNNETKVVQILSNSIDALGLRCADRIITMSKSMSQALIERFAVAPKKLHPLSNDLPKPDTSGNPISLGSSVGDSTLIVGCSGVLDARKNILLAIKACAGFSQAQDPQRLILLVAGAGPLFDEYSRYLQDNQVKNVRMLGWQDSLADLHRSCHLIVHPSLHEGVSNSLLEALAQDLPVLVSDCPEHRELLTYPELLFETTTAALTARLQQILDDRQALNQLRLYTQWITPGLIFDWDTEASNLVI